jgi:hypothetical protein
MNIILDRKGLAELIKAWAKGAVNYNIMNHSPQLGGE